MYIADDGVSKVDQKMLQLQNKQVPPKSHNIDDAEAMHGMPWKTSIGSIHQISQENNEENKLKSPVDNGVPLLYMPFWEWQMSFMKDNLTNLRVVPCSDATIHRHDCHYNENKWKKARIVNLCFQSEEYRKIRMTYYDAGDKTQVFNCLWYPHPKYNLPVLGVDLLAFNQKKYLTIVDFQPINDKEEDHMCTYEHLLKPIRDDYQNLKGRMSNKFYDENFFFFRSNGIFEV